MLGPLTIPLAVAAIAGAASWLQQLGEDSSGEGKPMTEYEQKTGLKEEDLPKGFIGSKSYQAGENFWETDWGQDILEERNNPQTYEDATGISDAELRKYAPDFIGSPAYQHKTPIWETCWGEDWNNPEKLRPGRDVECMADEALESDDADHVVAVLGLLDKSLNKARTDEDWGTFDDLSDAKRRLAYRLTELSVEDKD